MSSKYTSASPAVSDAPLTSGIDKRPEECGVAGCHDKVSVLQVIVLDDRGHERSGWWSDFAFTPSRLKDGFTFVGWVARCPVHYMRDVYAARRGTDSPITGTYPHLDWEAVAAHWQRLDAAKPVIEATI